MEEFESLSSADNSSEDEEIERELESLRRLLTKKIQAVQYMNAKFTVAASTSINDSYDGPSEPSEDTCSPQKAEIGPTSSNLYAEVVFPEENKELKPSAKAATVGSECTTEMCKPEAFVCETCQTTIHSCSPQEHIRTTLHLLNSRTEPPEKMYYITSSNVGYRLLKRYGWKESDGIGKDNQGDLDPVKIERRMDRRGIGVQPPPARRVTHIPSYREPTKHQACERHMIRQQGHTPRDIFDLISHAKSRCSLPPGKGRRFMWQPLEGINKRRRLQQLKNERNLHDLLRQELYH